MSGPLDFDDDPRDEPGEARKPKAPPPARPSGASRYSWFIGVAALILLGLVLVNALRTEGVQSGGPQAGDQLIPFAVPKATVETEKGANLLQKANDDGAPAACDVRSPEAINVCALWEDKPIALAIFPTEAAQCRAVLEQFERVAPRHPDVAFVAVGSLGEREDLVRRPWSFPVGWDPEGGVFSVYGVVECPQITFARRGGEVVETTRSTLTDDGLEARVERLG